MSKKMENESFIASYGRDCVNLAGGLIAVGLAVVGVALGALLVWGFIWLVAVMWLPMLLMIIAIVLLGILLK
jgi:lipopolysaccharide export LptBFGC system permease protein LptF